jgi:uncharacterized protein (TIGR02996 family)
MTKRAELLEQIRTTHDDHAYQVYADFVEQEGDQPRAMLIRWQCELANLARWDPRRRELQWEVDALIAEHGARWRRELPVLDGVEWTDFERGFVSAVRVNGVASLYEHADAIAAAAPVTCVELSRIEEHRTTPPASGIPWLRRVRLGDMGRAQFSETHSVLALATEIELYDIDEYAELSTLMTTLRRGRTVPLERLIVSGDHVAGATIAAGLDEIGVASLRELALGTAFVDEDTGYFGDPTMRTPGAQRVAARRLDKLEVLDITRQRVQSLGIETLVDSMPSLRELRAGSSEATSIDFIAKSHGAPIVALDLADNPIGDAGARALAAAPRTERLESLVLRRCEITHEGLSALVDAPFWPKLRRLDLAENPLNISGAIVLAEARAPKRLGELSLADTDGTRDAMPLLAELSWLWQLRILDLSRNEVSPALLGALADVRALRIVQVELDGDAAAALAPIFAQLRHLAIARNPLGDAGLAAFATDGAIETLDLRHCDLGDASLRLISTQRWPHLRALALSRNKFTADGVAALIRSPIAAYLMRLDLANCELDDAAIKVLADAPALAGLRSLTLAGMRLSEQSLLALARSSHLRAVANMRLSPAKHFGPAVQRELEARFGSGWQYYADIDDDSLM